MPRTTDDAETVAPGWSASPLLWALSLAREHGGAAHAVGATRLAYSAKQSAAESTELFDRLDGLTAPEAVAEALSLGMLAGYAAGIREAVGCPED